MLFKDSLGPNGGIRTIDPGSATGHLLLFQMCATKQSRVFAAARFRSTYRSLRPLLEDRGDTTDVERLDEEDAGRKTSEHFRARRTQTELTKRLKLLLLG